jgi:hypothetical protein
LAKIHFPNLLLLSVHPYGGRGRDKAVAEHNLTRFLLSHDTIEELYLFDWLSFDVSLLRASALPRLRSFNGSSAAFDAAVLVPLACLSTLRQLAIRFPYLGAYNINAIFANPQSSEVLAAGIPGCPSMLQQIELKSCNMPSSFLKDFIVGSARLFGSTLEVFRLDSISDDDIARLAPLFEPFRQLRVFNLTICSLYVSEPQKSVVRREIAQAVFRFLQELANQQATLREIRVYMHAPFWDHTWLITRTPDRGVDCPTDDCTGHLFYVPSPTLSTDAVTPLL